MESFCWSSGVSIRISTSLFVAIIFHQSRCIDQSTESMGDSSWVTVSYICSVFKFHNKHFDSELLCMLNVINLMHIVIHCLHITSLQKIEWKGSRFSGCSGKLAEMGPLMYGGMTVGWRVGFSEWQKLLCRQAGCFLCIDHCEFWFRLEIKVKYWCGSLHFT